MAEVELAMPGSRPYEYAHIKVDTEALGLSVDDPETMGRALTELLLALKAGQKQALDAAKKSTPTTPPVDILQGVPTASDVDNAMKVIESDAPGDVQAHALALLEQELGATVIEEFENHDPPYSPKNVEAAKGGVKPKAWQQKPKTVPNLFD